LAVGNAESDLLRERDRRTGLAVLLLVLGLHLLVLVLLPNQISIPAPRARSNRPVVVWLSPRAADSEVSHHVRSSPQSTVPASRAANARKARVMNHESHDSPAAAMQSVPKEGELPSSGPLRLDDETIRRAIGESRNGVERLAHNSGRGLATGSDQEPGLGQNIADASIPDCVRPDALKRMPVRIGGLLDLPLLAYAALKGLCR
jgi:hypothetical protein